MIPPRPGNFLFTSESVNDGHPDKICDQISDAILDACLKIDPDTKSGCETCARRNMVMVFGEIRTKAVVDYEKIVRDTAKKIGYDDEAKGLNYKTMDVLIKIEEQSPDIAQGVHLGRSVEEIGAGDQGHMFGYATDETKEYMPLSHALATRLGEKLREARVSKSLPYLCPDGKTQVTVEYRKTAQGFIEPVRVHTVLLSTQHTDEISLEQLHNDILHQIILPVIPKEYLDEDTRYIVNPCGRFVRGGPHGDAGLTGRKIIVDTYGGWGAHGGGAFSGKDATKVDRSGAYAARHAAKSLVAGGFARRVLLQLSYAIGLPEPLSLFVDSFGTAAKGLTDDNLAEIVKQNFDFRPGCIQRDLQLKSPIFEKTAVYGHFGRSENEFCWEKVKDLSHEWEKLKKNSSFQLNDVNTVQSLPVMN